MEFSELALRVLLLFFPGLLCTWIVDALTVHRKWAPLDVLLRSFVFGISAYGLYWARCRGCSFTIFSHSFSIPVRQFAFAKALLDSKAVISFSEIAIVSFIATAFALAFAGFATHKVGHRVARMLGCTRKSGELDVWGWAMNSREIQYATVRDHEKDLVYDGWIKSFSDDGVDHELLLNDVSVYRNSDGRPLYSVGAIYLCLDKHNFSIEFRDVPFSVGFQPIQSLDYERENAETAAQVADNPDIERGDDKERRRQSATDQPTPSSTSSSTTSSAKEKIIGSSLVFVLVLFGLKLACGLKKRVPPKEKP